MCRGICVWVIWSIACLRGLHAMYSISHALSHQFYFIHYSLQCFDGTIHWYCLMGSVLVFFVCHTHYYTLSYCLSKAFKLSEIWSSPHSWIISLRVGDKGKNISLWFQIWFRIFLQPFFLSQDPFCNSLCEWQGHTLYHTCYCVENKGWTPGLIEKKTLPFFFILSELSY